MAIYQSYLNFMEIHRNEREKETVSWFTLNWHPTFISIFDWSSSTNWSIPEKSVAAGGQTFLKLNLGRFPFIFKIFWRSLFGPSDVIYVGGMCGYWKVQFDNSLNILSSPIELLLFIHKIDWLSLLFTLPRCVRVNFKINFYEWKKKLFSYSAFETRAMGLILSHKNVFIFSSSSLNLW